MSPAAIPAPSRCDTTAETSSDAWGTAASRATATRSPDTTDWRSGGKSSGCSKAAEAAPVGSATGAPRGVRQSATSAVDGSSNSTLELAPYRKIDDIEDRQIRCSGLNGQCLGILCLAPQAGQAALQRTMPYKSSFTPQRKFPIIRPLRTFCDREAFYWRDQRWQLHHVRSHAEQSFIRWSLHSPLSDRWLLVAINQSPAREQRSTPFGRMAPRLVDGPVRPSGNER